MGFSGSIGEIDRIAKGLEKEGAAMGGVARKAKAAIERQVAAAVSAQQDPYGEPWEPRVDGSPLADMVPHVRVTANSAEISASTVGREGGYFHSGTKKQTARPLIPNDDQGIPDAWLEALDAAVAEASGEPYVRTPRQASRRKPTLAARLGRAVKRAARRIARKVTG